MKSAPNPQNRDVDRDRESNNDHHHHHHGLPSLHPKDAPTRNRNSKYKHLIMDMDLSIEQQMEHDHDTTSGARSESGIGIEREEDEEAECSCDHESANASAGEIVHVSTSHEQGNQMRQSQLCKLQSSSSPPHEDMGIKVNSVFIPRVVTRSSDEFDNDHDHKKQHQKRESTSSCANKELSWDLPKPHHRRRHVSEGHGHMHGHGHGRHGGRHTRRQKRCSTKQALSAFAIKPSRHSSRSGSTSKSRGGNSTMDGTNHSYEELRQPDDGASIEEKMEQLHISQQPQFEPLQPLSFDIPLSDILSIERDTLTQNPISSSLGESNSRGRRNSQLNIGVIHIYYQTPSSDVEGNADAVAADDMKYTTSYLQLKPDTTHGRDLLLAFLRASKLRSEEWRKIAAQPSKSMYPTLQLSALMDSSAHAAETNTNATSIDPRYVIDLEITDRLEELRKELKFESENKDGAEGEDDDGATTMDASAKSLPQDTCCSGSPMTERKKVQQLELQRLQERRRRRSIGHKVFSERTKKLLVDQADCNTPNARPTSSSSSIAEVDMQHFEDRAVKSRFANETFFERWVRRSSRFAHRLDESKFLCMIIVYYFDMKVFTASSNPSCPIMPLLFLSSKFSVHMLPQ